MLLGDLGRLGECFLNASGLGEAWVSLGLSQPAEKMLLEHFFALLHTYIWSSALRSPYIKSPTYIRGPEEPYGRNPAEPLEPHGAPRSF